MSETEMAKDNATENEEPKNIKAFDVVEAGLAKMKKALEVVPDATEKEGYELIADTVRGGKALIKQVDEAEKKEKRPLMDKLDLIRSEGKRIKQEVKDTIDPWIKAKKEQDDEVERQRAIKREARKKHQAMLEEMVAEFANQVASVVGKSAEEIKHVLDGAIATDVENGMYEERTDDAIVERQMAIEKLEKMHQDAVEFEEKKKAQDEAEAKLKKDREEFEEQQRIAREKEEAKEKERLEKEEADRKEREERERVRREKEQKAEEERQRMAAIKTKIDSLKEVLADIVQCKTSVEMKEVKEAFREDVFKYDFQEFEQDAVKQHNALASTILDIIKNKVEEENRKAAIELENKRLKEAEDKRIKEENDRKREEFEKQEAARLKKEAEDKLAADIEVNKKMKTDAIHAIVTHVETSSDAQVDQFLEAIETGKIPNISVQWNPELTKEEE